MNKLKIKTFCTCMFNRDFWEAMKEANKFFERKSQHYIFGNWKQYVRDKSAVFKYELQYPRAWVKFMWNSCKDFVKEHEAKRLLIN